MAYYELGNCLRGYHAGEFETDDEAWDALSDRFNRSWPSRSGRYIQMSKIVREGQTVGGNETEADRAIRESIERALQKEDAEKEKPKPYTILPTDAAVLQYLDGVIGVVEANSYETMCLWKEYHQEHGKPWQDIWHGYVPTIGYVGDLPVTLSLLTSTIQGHKILFIDSPSRVTDWDLVEEWLAANLPRTAFRDGQKNINKTNAMNFSNVFPYEPHEKVA